MNIQVFGCTITFLGALLALFGFLAIILRMLLEAGAPIEMCCLLVGIIMILMGLLISAMGE